MIRPTRRKRVGAASATSALGRAGCRRSCGCASWDAGGGEPVFAGRLHRRVQSPFSGRTRQRGNALCPASRRPGTDFLAAVERSVNRDNTVSFQNLCLQIERVRGGRRWRVASGGAPTPGWNLESQLRTHCLGRYDATGAPLSASLLQR